MQLQTYLRILLRRGWIMVLLAVITAAAAFVFSQIREARAPVYEASIRVLVQPARTDFGQTQAASQLLRSYVAWMDSSFRAQDVIDDLQLDMSPQQLRGDVTIASDNSRLVIQIDAESSSPEIAAQVARRWAELFIDYRNQENDKVQRQDRIDALIIDDPAISLAEPNTTINTAAGAVAGFLIGLAIVFVLEYIESGIIRSSEDVDRFLELPVLGAIPPVEG